MAPKSTINSLVTSTILIAEELHQSGHVIQATALHETAQRLSAIGMALKDAIATYDPKAKETFVSAERQEAWIDALGRVD